MTEQLPGRPPVLHISTLAAKKKRDQIEALKLIKQYQRSSEPYPEAMAALMAVLRANKHRSPTTQIIEIEDDPYSFTSQFPPEQDRILDVVLGKLMLDG